MPTIVGLLSTLDRAHTLQERRDAAESWVTGEARKVANLCRHRHLIDDDGQGGWTLTGTGRARLAALQTVRKALEDAAGQIDEAEGRLAEVVVQARDDGWSLRQIASATGLNHQTIANIERRART